MVSIKQKGGKGMKMIIWSRILFGVGVVLFIFYVGGLIYFYNFQEYSPYASYGPDIDAFIHSVLILPSTIICILLSLMLRILYRNKRR